MKEKIKEELNKHLTLLPKESQEVINSFDWVKITEEIGKKYALQPKDIEILQVNVGVVLVGLDEQEALVENIESDVIIAKKDAEKITEEIIEKIIKPIYEKLCEKIKNNLKSKPVNWQQNVDFILSGGDYTAFIREPIKIKDEILKSNSSFNPSKVDDLKSKFTI